MGILTIILTDGPYISGYANMAYKMARAAQKMHRVNIFLYLDAVHIPKIGQNPALFANTGKLFADLTDLGVRVEACARCATARGYAPKNGKSDDYVDGIDITSLYSLSKMIEESDRVVVLG
jgi:tRNA 2-thiouridine synthesizing protein D